MSHQYNKTQQYLTGIPITMLKCLFVLDN